MQQPRKYTATEIKEFIVLIRNGGDISQEKIAGMDMLVETLHKFGNMTDAEMEEYAHSAYRVLKKDECLQSIKSDS